MIRSRFVPALLLLAFAFIFSSQTFAQDRAKLEKELEALQEQMKAKMKEFLEPLSLSQSKIAKDMGVPIQRVNTLINGKRGVTAETAILLSRILKTTPEFWMNLQNAYDLYEAKLYLKQAA